MIAYKVVVSNQVQRDIRRLVRHITIIYGQPKTASLYREGVWNTIRSLSRMAGVRPKNEYVQARYGANARHIRYKNVVIIYVIKGDQVHVRLLIPSSLLH
jgi:plasmid stabilization system protein ParE